MDKRFRFSIKIDNMINPIIRNTNTLFALLFKNGDNDPTRDSFNKY